MTHSMMHTIRASAAIHFATAYSYNSYGQNYKCLYSPTLLTPDLHENISKQVTEKYCLIILSTFLGNSLETACFMIASSRR